MTQPSAMDTGSGSGTQPPLGLSTPPSGPLSSPIDEAAGYALEIHDEFWATVPSKKRAKLVTDFVARAKAVGSAGASELVKVLVSGFGVDVPDYRAAAAIVAGYETHECLLRRRTPTALTRTKTPKATEPQNPRLCPLLRSSACARVRCPPAGPISSPSSWMPIRGTTTGQRPPFLPATSGG